MESHLNLHFIVGMSRSGTTWLMQCLNNHSRVSAFGETGYFGKNDLGKEYYNTDDLEFIKKSFSILDKNSKVCEKSNGLLGSFEKICVRYPSNNLTISKKDLFTDFINEIKECSHSELIIEKTPHHINYLQKIRSYYPESKFLICFRDSSSFLLSYKHQGDRKDSKIKKNFKRSYHPYLALKVYNTYARKIKEVKNDQFTFLINFNRIVSDQKNLLKEVQEFLEIKKEDILIGKTNSSFTSAKVPSINLEDRLWLNWMTEDTFTFNYKEKLIFPLVITFSLIKLPIAGGFVLRNFIKTAPIKNILPHLRTYIKK